MLFLLKKFIAFWLMPLPFCVALVAAGWWLTRPSRPAGRGRFLIAVGVLLLLFFSNNFASVWLLRPLENRYAPIPEEMRPGEAPPTPLAACRYVVVLGGGHTDISDLSATNKLSSSALSRIVEGVRLLRVLPGAQLIVSGPAPGRPSHASVLAQAAVSLGVERDRIRLIDQARDTEDESRAVKAIVGDAPVALVTSAWHMPRAAADFHAAGVNFLPCPADFKSRIDDHPRWSEVAWDIESLERSTAAVHERIGALWMRLRH